VNFAVGDRVIKRRHMSGCIVDGDLANVYRVDSRKVTLDDGSAWRLDGYQWGSGGKRLPGGEVWRIHAIASRSRRR
jgi:hypothetical protein